MPTPWSSRLPPSSLYNPFSNSANPDLSAPSRVPAPSHITDNEITVGNPILDPSVAAIRPPANTPAKPTRVPSRHGRSVSHPFPALFSGKKKRTVPLIADDGTTPFDLTDDGILRTTPHQNASRVPDKDLAVGHCMTCNSTVKWPKELVVFRCSVCMTINDLKPGGREVSGGGGNGQRRPSLNVAGPSPPVLQVPLLSVQRTERIIRECLDEFFLGILDVSRQLEGGTHGQLDRAHEQGDFLDSSKSSGGALADLAVPLIGDSQRSRHSELDIYEKTVRSKSFSALVDSEPTNFRPNLNSGNYTFPTNRGNIPPAPQGPFKPCTDEPAPHSGLPNPLPSDRGSQRATFKDDIFRPLEDYITSSFASYECINNSFPTRRPFPPQRTRSDSIKRARDSQSDNRPQESENIMSEIDAKTLLIGDIAENGLWWTGRSGGRHPVRSSSHRNGSSGEGERLGNVSIRSPRIEWTELQKWYTMVCCAGQGWRSQWNNVLESNKDQVTPQHRGRGMLSRIDEEISESQAMVQRTLLKATESLLKRPGQPLKQPEEIRFLLVILGNPLLYPGQLQDEEKRRSRSRSRSKEIGGEGRFVKSPPSPSRSSGNPAAQHSGILKRILGLLSNLPNECHHHLVLWFSGFQESQFRRITELIGSFVTYRLTRQHGKRHKKEELDPTAGLIPTLGSGSSAYLHDALDPQRSRGNSKKSDGKTKQMQYDDDWQIKAAARVMSILFTANSKARIRRIDPGRLPSAQSRVPDSSGRSHHNSKFMDVSDFYNTLLDYSDLISDFEAWESRKAKFAFCQYPFFLSIWAKIRIMEYDTRRQMESKAREAFFNSILRSTSISQYMVLKVRRECLVEDSLRGVSEVLGSGGEDLKKGLRIEFTGEEGVDAGGLRKEWFLLLVRDVFNPEHALFTYDDDSQYCYFNPNTFETSDQYFLVGVVLGLAIYNSTILDVALPPFAYRKLLAGGPPVSNLSHSISRPTMNYTLDDLAEFRPALAAGLRQLLEFDGDVENTFCRDFVADVDKYGQSVQVPLCSNGENTPVTNSNRRTFVDLYVRYLLDTSVARQFEPFKRGFFTVCGGNALSLFQPEEIEKLIRGSEEALDISSLRAVSVYENWCDANDPNKKKANAAAPDREAVVKWFWETFESAEPKSQRKLLSFITGSDRIPAMGATSLVIKVNCLGEECGRFPTARTCFNVIGLWRYGKRETLERMLWTAVEESEGFGLK